MPSVCHAVCFPIGMPYMLPACRKCLQAPAMAPTRSRRALLGILTGRHNIGFVCFHFGKSSICSYYPYFIINIWLITLTHINMKFLQLSVATLIYITCTFVVDGIYFRKFMMMHYSLLYIGCFGIGLCSMLYIGCLVIDLCSMLFIILHWLLS